MPIIYDGSAPVLILESPPDHLAIETIPELVLETGRCEDVYQYDLPLDI